MYEKHFNFFTYSAASLLVNVSTKLILNFIVFIISDYDRGGLECRDV